MSQTFTVPKISNGPATADALNKPLEYIEESLNELQSNIQDANTSSAVLQWQTPIAASVSVGDLVYFNKTTGKFEKALAALSSQMGTSGQAIQEDSCHVQGIILSIDSTDNSAVMLRSGYYESAVVQGAIGTGASAGIYYLSTTTAGKATATPGWEVRLPCISYYGAGKFTMISNYYAHIGDGDSVVRSINSTTLSVASSNGTVVINTPTRTVSEPEASAYAVSSFTNTNISMTPIVSMLLGGAGIKASYKGSGIWSVALDSLINKPLTATDFTLNGAQRVTDSLLTYTVFPAGSQTSMVMTMPVDFISSTAFQGSIKLWMTTRGPGNGAYSATVYWIPYSSSPVTITNCQIGTTSIASNNTSTTQIKYFQSLQIPNVSMESSGVLVARVSVNSPTYDMYVHQAGFKLNVEESSDSASYTSESIRQQVVSILEEYLTFNPNYSGI